MQINNKIKKLREFSQITQEEMAENLGMSVNNYARIERGRAKLNVEILEKICTVLGINIIDLLNFDDKNIIYLLAHNDYVVNCSRDLNVGLDPNVEIEKLRMALENKNSIMELKDKLLAQQEQELITLRKIIDKLGS